MNYLLEYEEFGEINRTAPLEAFYEAMLPQLENYGVTAEFPADKPSLAESINGIEHDVFVGNLPNAVRYLKWQGSPYANGGFELTLESETLVHKETGNKLAFKIFISDYIRGMKHESENFSLILKFRGEQSEVESLRKAIAPVLEKYNFQSHEVKKAQIISDNLEEKSNKNSNSELMTNNVNFDELAQKAFAPTAGESDFENLFAAVFSLDAWYFIADAEFQNKMPYCAPLNVFDGAITLMVFTDGERARKYIAEGGLKGGAAVENSAPEDLIMRISTDGILDFFDKLAPFNIAKIFFNPNIDSQGFHHDLKMMRPIYEHVKNKGLLAQTETAVENSEYNLSKLLAENADVIADFDRENQDYSHLIGASAAAMNMTDEAGKEQITSKMVDMFENLRAEYKMSPKLFRVYIESCLNERKLLMPVLAFAYLRQDKTKWATLEQDKEFVDEYARWLTVKLVPGADLLMDEPVDEINSKNDSSADQTSEKESIESGIDFDALSEKAMATNAMEDLNALFGAAFALDKWNFIARGELPNVGPYIASNPAAADNQPMVRAFTDADRLMRFARENNLTDADGSAKILTMPTATIIPYLENLSEQGAFGVWFNSDSESKDFFIPIKQLQPIKDHLAKLNLPPNIPNQTGKKTLLLLVQDGLGFPSGFVSEASFKLNIFCRVPENWTNGEQLTSESQEKIFEFLYGANWRNGNDDGSRYVVIDSFSKVFDDETVKTTRWEGTENTDTNRFKFYLVSADGAIKSVKAEEFQADIDAELQRQTVAENRQSQDNAAKFGVSETADGSFDQNLNLNQVGAVNFETSIAPFYEAIVPLLQDFQGTGEYVTLLRFEDSGKSQEVENIASNSHGAYLQIRRFLYLNPKNNTRIGVNSIHSNHLRHVQTNAELILSFELCKNLDNQTGVFYHAFQGPKSEVLKLSEAIQPILEANNYQAVH